MVGTFRRGIYNYGWNIIYMPPLDGMMSTFFGFIDAIYGECSKNPSAAIFHWRSFEMRESDR